MTVIIGAGLSGLMAANVFPTAKVFEAGSSDQLLHKAVLRFRSRAVSDAIGIEFKSVQVRKGIWLDGKFCNPDIRLANWYAMKVVGNVVPRSIWNLDSVERFIAPEDVVQTLAERCANRITWNSPVGKDLIEEFPLEEPIISTIPMPVIAGILNISTSGIEFKRAPITVRRWRLPHASVHQTVYFPSPATTLYRVSITGDLIIAEYAGKPDDYYFFDAFGIIRSACEEIDTTSQGYGKIANIDEKFRKKFIFDLTTNHNIFSAGRFAIYKNVLADDVLQDLFVIKRLMNAGLYERSKHNAS